MRLLTEQIRCEQWSESDFEIKFETVACTLGIRLNQDEIQYVKQYCNN
jgi:hypothetical protein